MKNKHPKSCLVISYGPVPTDQYKKVEGGGMRAWGLATGLQANGADVTVAINDAFPQEVNQQSGITIENWSPNEAFKQRFNSFDAVIINYSMGSDAVFVAENIDTSTTLILDCYVPIYVEVSARKSNNVENELIHYVSDLDRWNYVLRRGDYFLCANESQKSYYIGALGALGILNPYSYDKDRLLIAPFGIHREVPSSVHNPYEELSISKNDTIFLWFGGLYPWFRVDDYLNSITETLRECPDAKFVFVGGKNPFNPNPDFSKQYDKAVAFAQNNKLINSSIFFVDWVDYDDRVNWYKYASVVVSFNQPGKENGFSWRTRVMDYLWGEVVSVTNGGDPLGDELVESGAAFHVDNLQSTSITKVLTNIYKNPNSVETKLSALQKVRTKYFWDKLTSELYAKITSNNDPYATELAFRTKLGIDPVFMKSYVTAEKESGVTTNRFRRLYVQPLRIYHIAKSKGIRRSLSLAKSTVKSKVSSSLSRSEKIIIISNPIDNSGAPMVLMGIIRELYEKGLIKNTRILTNYTTKNNLTFLKQHGLNPEKTAIGLNLRLVGMQLSLNKNDAVLMNTVAIYPNYRDYVLNALSADKLSKATWFIHEDIEQTKVITPELFADEYIEKIRMLVKNNKLFLLVPSVRVARDYEKLFSLHENTVKVVSLHVDVEDIYQKKKTPKDYGKLGFYMSGNSSDGRKGQLLAIAAFQKFIDKYQSVHPEQYRKFDIHFVAIGESDYVSTQIKLIGDSVLGKNLHTYPPLPRDEALSIASKCNTVLCCSLNETFGLYIAEGMLMGHVVLRNKSAGFEEQLVEGKNGYFMDISNIEQMAKTLEKVLNKKTISNEKLCNMGDASKQIAREFSKNSYLDQIELFV